MAESAESDPQQTAPWRMMPYKNVVLFEFCTEIDKFPDFKIRDDDVWVCSYPRSDPSLVEIYQERRPGGVDYTSHNLHELGVTALDNITFKVKAANDAYILLRRSRTDYQGQIVEIVIGGWANQKSVIRSSQQQDPPEAEYLASGLLAPDEYRSFWISWDRGTVMVGKGSSPGQETIMVWGGLVFNVTYIAVGVGYGSDAHWQFTSDDSKAESTFSYTIKNISKLKKSTLSPKYMVRNLPWKIMAKPPINQKGLGFYLLCNAESDSTYVQLDHICGCDWRNGAYGLCEQRCLPFCC